MKIIKVKSAGGSYFFQLEDSEGQRTPRVFEAEKGRVTIVPVQYAMSFFNSPVITKWIEDGRLIIVEGEEFLNNKAVEEGYIPEAIKPQDHSKILAVLKGNDITAMKELLNGEDQKLAFEIATSHSNELTQSVIAYIEKNFGVAITDD